MTRMYTGKFGDCKYIKTRRLNIEIILHENISIKAYYFILKCPLFDLFKVSTGMLNLRNLLCLLSDGIPFPRKWRDVNRAHKALSQSIEAM